MQIIEQLFGPALVECFVSKNQIRKVYSICAITLLNPSTVSSNTGLVWLARRFLRMKSLTGNIRLLDLLPRLFFSL